MFGLSKKTLLLIVLALFVGAKFKSIIVKVPIVGPMAV